MIRTTLMTVALSTGMINAAGQITKPEDAPRPLTPSESAQTFQIPDGFRLELVASEPLIRQPSSVCWDEQGRLFVTELHGYNMEGQFDIEELNKTGELDRVVRRIAADEEAVRKAEQTQIGSVKLLKDNDGDGVMDEAITWADDLPVGMGICPALGGVVVVCSPDIIFMADVDGDERPDVRKTLFTGFRTGVIERRINSPQWGPDNWIYVDGGQGGRITGPALEAAVDLPGTGFRFKPDGSVIEPVSGHTGTYGFAFNTAGDRFVISTGTPAIQVAPLPWRSMARNPDIALSASQRRSADYNRSYPISQPHPWRSKRASDPGFSKYYRDRYGEAEAAANGYFTSACTPFIYRDTALPGLNGQLLACAPAQNLIHRAAMTRDGILVNAHRVPEEERSEFLASTDIWFHPIHLATGPDGCVYISDFYREIIEDYSAIPRYLQQQYGLESGKDHGRIWRLAHSQTPTPKSSNLDVMCGIELVEELASPRFWRRQTARRLLIERASELNEKSIQRIAALARNTDPEVALEALYSLEGIGALDVQMLVHALNHTAPEVIRHALRLSEPMLFQKEGEITQAVLNLISHSAPIVQIQLAISLGEIPDVSGLGALAQLAREHGDVAWMETAILSSLGKRSVPMLEILLTQPNRIGNARSLTLQLLKTISNRQRPEEFSICLKLLQQTESAGWIIPGLTALQSAFQSPTPMVVSEEAKTALLGFTNSSNSEVREAALKLIRTIHAETQAERDARIQFTLQQVSDLQLSPDQQVAAALALGAENDSSLIQELLQIYPTATPAIRQAILDSAFSRTSFLPVIVEALENNVLPVSAISHVQRESLLNLPAPDGLSAREILSAKASMDQDLYDRFIAALSQKRDRDHGETVFRENCATCHQAHGIGFTVGPDLTSEFRRAEETMVNDILFPGATIVPGHETYIVEMKDERILSGILSSESANSLVLTLPGGIETPVLRKDIRSLKSIPVSLMPESLAETLKPKDVADVIAWLRQPHAKLDRKELLYYLDENGKKRPVESSEDWKHRRAAILEAALSIMGPLPGPEKEVSLDMQILEEVDCGSYVRRLIEYTSEPGSQVPAYLLIPKSLLQSNSDKTAPAVLCLHPTDNQIGHKVVVGLGGRPNRQYAAELAERGFVTLAPSYPLLANYQPDVIGLGYESGTMKAIWDNIRGVDLLQSLPFVQKNAVGAIGHSLGGHNAVYTAVFDPRIQVIVSSCGLDSYRDYYDGNPDVWNPGRGWTQLRYMPKLAGYQDRLEEIPFDFHELIGALAPRHVFISAPLHDSNFRWKSVDKIKSSAMQVYQLYDSCNRLIVRHPDCDHDFPEPIRLEAYRLLESVLTAN